MSQLLRGAALAAITLAVMSATPASAQSFPNINKAKEAATRSVNATNAHTAAETADQSPQPIRQPAPQPAASTVASAGSVKTPAPTPGKAGAGPGKASKSSAPAAAAVPAASKSEISLVRETFNYSADGRRDPFMSLMKTGELRPAVSDLKLVTVIYDPAGRSVAILRDLTTKEQYRIKVGQTLGRMRVASIQPKSVTFTVIAIGTTFQEVLALNDTTRARTQ
jgi:hypothetical protein